MRGYFTDAVLTTDDQVRENVMAGGLREVEGIFRESVTDAGGTRNLCNVIEDTRGGCVCGEGGGIV